MLTEVPILISRGSETLHRDALLDGLSTLLDTFFKSTPLHVPPMGDQLIYFKKSKKFEKNQTTSKICLVGA